MAIGRHWEWRGFGDVSEQFRRRLQELPLAFADRAAWGVVDDEYLWVPGSRINVKLRTGIEDGLKFKRMERTDGDIELWFEDPEELYPYGKLNEITFKKLAEALQITLHSVAPGVYDRQKTLDLLARSDPTPVVVKVSKRRQTRLFAISGSSLKVEIAEISAPEGIASVGIETPDLAQDTNAADLDAARNNVLSAIDQLGLQHEALLVKNYINALELWGNGRRLGPVIGPERAGSTPRS